MITKSQYEILKAVAEGLSYSQIAKKRGQTADWIATTVAALTKQGYFHKGRGRPKERLTPGAAIFLDEMEKPETRNKMLDRWEK